MKPSEMKVIYQEACRAASTRPVPDDAQEKIWRQTMGGFDAADIRGGLEIWWQTEKYLPMPAELKPLAERARLSRIAKKSGLRDEVRWRCPDCGVTMTGFIDPADDRPRICRGTARNGPQHDAAGNSIPCGAVMNEIQRDKAS
jgi:hypothetical protein